MKKNRIIKRDAASYRNSLLAEIAELFGIGSPHGTIGLKKAKQDGDPEPWFAFLGVLTDQIMSKSVFADQLRLSKDKRMIASISRLTFTNPTIAKVDMPYCAAYIGHAVHNALFDAYGDDVYLKDSVAFRYYPDKPRRDMTIMDNKLYDPSIDNWERQPPYFVDVNLPINVDDTWMMVLELIEQMIIGGIDGYTLSIEEPLGIPTHRDDMFYISLSFKEHKIGTSANLVLLVRRGFIDAIKWMNYAHHGLPRI